MVGRGEEGGGGGGGRGGGGGEGGGGGGGGGGAWHEDISYIVHSVRLYVHYSILNCDSDPLKLKKKNLVSINTRIYLTSDQRNGSAVKILITNPAVY